MRMIAQALQVARSNLTVKKQTRSVIKKGDPELLIHIKEVAQQRPTYGYRRITALLNEKLKKLGSPAANRKKVFRLMKRHHLLLQKPTLKPVRSHNGKVETLHSNTRWCSDTLCIQCLNGKQVHVAFSIDTCDREVMRYIASTRGIDGKMIRDLMVETVEYRTGHCQTAYPIQWLTDNGSCYTAKETVDCGRRLGLDIRTTPAYSPESNGIAEAFVKTLKRDYVWLSDIRDAKTVMEQLPKWIEDYNERAPHKALKMCSPRVFIKKQKLAS